MDVSWAGERLILCNDRELGARAAIAVDDTSLGPALGGVRYAAYDSEARAVEEAARLAAAMTLKNAAAELPFGGAKSVILRSGLPVDRSALMLWFAGCVAELDGAYIPGVDVGTSVADLAEMASVVPDVACHDEDPSPWTALGVLESIRAALRHLGEESLAGQRVVIQGAGHVGASLADLLRREDAEVELADVDAERAATVAAAVGARTVDPREALFRECDVLAPCAMARVLDSESVARLRCRVVAGAANDSLASDAIAQEVASRGIVYVPDFLANAGGVVQIHALRQGWSDERLRAEILRIGDRVGVVLERAQHDSALPLDAAKALAARVLGRGAAVGSPA